MGPYDPFVEEGDDLFADLNADFSVTRRGFLGGLGASTIAATAWASTSEEYDETGIRFEWGVDATANGAAVFDVTILISKRGALAADSENDTDTDATATDYPADRRRWRIRPEVFGPNAQFIVRHNGNKSYRLRIANVGFGRLKKRSIEFIFTQHELNVDVGGVNQSVKRYGLTARTDIWSAHASPTSTDPFTMGAEQDSPIPGILLFREFINPHAPQRLHYRPTLKRVVNTTVLMFNGLIDVRRGLLKARKTDLWFGPDGKWSVEDDTPILSVVGQRVNLKSLEVFWRLNDPAASQVAVDAPLLAIAKTEPWAEDGEDPTPIRIGNRERGPVMSLTRADGGEKVYFRMQRPRDGEGNVIKNAKLRAEAVLPAKWRDLGFVSKARGRSAEGFPDLEGSLLQRVDAPIRASNKNYTLKGAGTLSLQGSYTQTKIKSQRLETGLGAISVIPIRARENEDEAENELFQFPVRRGWVVTALYSWRQPRGNEGSPPTLGAPQAEFIEVNVGMVEAGIKLPEADYSRLTFEPTELRVYYSTVALGERPLGSYLNLGADRRDEFARLDLARATLRASQSDALVSLKFRFSDMALSFSRGHIELVSYSTACEVTTRPSRHDRLQPYDNRPVLVVEFPPQHLFEEAKFSPTILPLPDVSTKRRVTVTRNGSAVVFDTEANEYQEPPLYEVDGDTVSFDSDNRRHVTDLLDWLSQKQREDFRKKFRALKFPKLNVDGDQARERFKTVAQAAFSELQKLVKAHKLPADQAFYIGPFALDVDAMQVVRITAENLREEAVRTVVDNMLTAAQREMEKYPAPGNVDEALALENRLQSAVPSYQQFRTLYREEMYALLLGQTIGLADYKGFEPTASTPFETEFLLSVVRDRYVPAELTPGQIAQLKKRLDIARLRFITALQQIEPLGSASRARLSNPSRLAFRVRCRDGLDYARTQFREREDHTRNASDSPEDAEDRLPRDKLRFSFSDLTNFRGMELSVMARAETVYDPGELGLISARRPRVADTSVDAMLDRLQFTRGKQVSVRTRLAEIAASLLPPTALETSIEMPARITLSPNQNAVILTPGKGVPEEIYDLKPAPCGVPGADAGARSHVLWQARFVTEADGLGLDPGLRAVWSPDLRPGALLTRFADGAPRDSRATIVHGEPPAGPIAPWFLTLLQAQASSMTRAELELIPGFENACTRIDEPAESAKLPTIVVEFCKNLLQQQKQVDPRDGHFRTSIDARARHQLVLLSSAWGLPVVGRRQSNLELSSDSSQLEASEGLKLFDLWPGNAIFRPKTLDVSELSLTTLGGTLRHDTGFQPPTGALFWRDKRPVFDALSLERWQQWTNIGRDIFTEVVHKGFLFPLGIRASLVQVTERIFYMEKESGAITAPLRQRMFIRVANPDKLYPAIKQPFGGRRWPVRSLRMLTTVTPDIVDPNADGKPAEDNVSPAGRIDLKFEHGGPTKGLVFWPRIFQSPAGTIRFEFNLDESKCDLPLIFVDNTAASDPDTLQALKTYYASKVESPDDNKEAKRFVPARHMRTVVFGGANRRYADEIENGSATFQTDHWTLRASGQEAGITLQNSTDGGLEQFLFQNDDHTFGPLLQGADQPPFYPVVETARIHLTQAERLTAKDLSPVRAHFDARYVVHGFRPKPDEKDASTTKDTADSNVKDGNSAEVILVVRDAPDLDMGKKGNQSGGVFRPKGYVVALSRAKGAMTQNARPFLGKMDVADRMYSVAGKFEYEKSDNLKTALAEQSTGSTGSGALTDPIAQQSADSDPFAEIRKIYQDFFSDDSKLLGLVSIRDLIAFIRSFNTPEEGLPELDETMEFGAGLAEGAEDAANAVRENVIVPLSAAARRVREGWDQIEDNLANAQDVLQNQVEKITIGEVFPELDTALTELARALARAEGETDEVAFALELGACYSAGQQFLSAVQRSAANPAQRIEDAITKRFTAVLGLFRLIEGNLDVIFLNFVRHAIEEKTGIDTDDAIENARIKLRMALQNVIKESFTESRISGTQFEVIALPRSSGIYYNSDGTLDKGNQSTFEKCVETLTPDADDVRAILNAFVDWATQENTIINFIENPPVQVEGVLSDFLRSSTAIAFDDTKLNNIIGKTKADADKFVSDQLKAIGTEIKKHVVDNPVPNSDTHKKIDQKLDEIAAEISNKFLAVLQDGKVALANGDVKTRIRNRYALCVIINFAKDAGACALKIKGLDPKWLRDFVDWLAKLVETPELEPLVLPNLAGIFDPLARLLRQLVEILRAIKDRDILAIFRWLARLLQEIGLPKLNVDPDSLCQYLDPVWNLTAQVMTDIAEIGEELSLVPDTWTVPVCAKDGGKPVLGDMSRFADVTEFEKLPGGKEKSLIGSILTVKAHSDLLGGAANAADSEFGEAYDELKTSVDDILTDLPNFEGAATIETDLRDAQARLAAGLAETRQCLKELSEATEDAYCALLEDERALSAAIRDLRAASKLKICIDATTIDTTTFDALFAMSHLPRDFRSVGDRREAVLKTLQNVYERLIVVFAKIEKATSDNTPLLIAIGLTAAQIIEPFEVMAQKAPDQSQQWVDDLKAKIREFKEPVDDLAHSAQNVAREALTIVCRVLDYADTLFERSKKAIETFDANIAELEAQAASIEAEAFGIDIERFIARAKAEIDTNRLVADLARLNAKFEELSELREKLCMDSDSNGTPDLVENLGSLSDLPVNSVRDLNRQSGKLSELSTAQLPVPRALSKLVDEVRTFAETGPRNAGLRIMKPIVEVILKNASIGDIGIDVPGLSSGDQIGLIPIYETMLKAREKLVKQLEKRFPDPLLQSLYVRPDGARVAVGTYVPGTSGDLKNENDQLAGDVAWLKAMQSGLDLESESQNRFAAEFLREWTQGVPTPIIIFRNVTDLIEDILSGDIFKHIDFAALREEFEEYLLSLVPSKLRMGYGFNIELGSEVSKATAGIFTPAKGTELGVDMKIVVNLLATIEDGTPSIDFRSVGTLGPFEIKLVGDFFDALTLRFAGATFISEGGDKSDIEIVFKSHKIGPKLKFVQKLQKYLAPKDGSGVILRFYPEQPGIEAGYRLHLGDFSVGNLAFTNVGLETTAILPFSDSEALFKASLSSRANPFTLTYAPYGGSGFFGIFATVDGIVGFEAGFEFGGSAVFAFGPLSGKGRLMSGVYIRQLKLNGVRVTEISMTFFAGGTASIWIFNFGAALSLKMGMVNGAMSGEATFCFSFSMGLSDFEYSVQMVKQEGENFSGNSAMLGPPGPTRFAALGDTGAPHQLGNQFDAKVETEGKCQSKNWHVYKTYFDDIPPPTGYF